MTDTEGTGDWIEWEGGECPLPASAFEGEVEIRFRYGGIGNPCGPEPRNWLHDGVDPEYDYVAYRIVRQP